MPRDRYEVVYQVDGNEDLKRISTMVEYRSSAKKFGKAIVQQGSRLAQEEGPGICLTPIEVLGEEGNPIMESTSAIANLRDTKEIRPKGFRN